MRANAGRLYMATKSAASGDASVFSGSFFITTTDDDDNDFDCDSGDIAFIFPLIKFLCVIMSCDACSAV